MSNVAQLLACLPEDTWVFRDDDLQGYPVMFLRKPLYSEDWSTLQRYARRVQTLGRVGTASSRFSNARIQGESLAELSVPPTSSPLFPSLRAINWSDDRICALPLLRLLIGPRLVHLSFDIPSMHKLAPILHCASTFCPLLKTLNAPHQDSDDAGVVLSESLDGWPCLEKLLCGPVTDDALYHLATLPSLRSLSLWSCGFNHFQSITERLANPGSAFENLQELQVGGNRIADCTALLRLVSATELSTINYQGHSLMTKASTSSEIGKFCALLWQCHEVVTDISITEPCHDPPEFVQDYVITFDMIRDLGFLVCLTRLHLDTTCTFYLDDRALSELADGWPYLEIILLGAIKGHRLRQDPLITLKGLASLVGHCPLLTDIGILLNATEVEPISEQRTKGTRNANVTILRFGDSKVGPPSSVAAFLSALVPNVVGIKTFEEPQGMVQSQAKQNWAQVERLLLMFAQVRAHERAFRIEGESDSIEFEGSDHGNAGLHRDEGLEGNGDGDHPMD
ncbi:hypothetical protein BV22DRAFT_1036044 [Leucogyrophana mollusca]|uniref:Uncharacterized protein n=1 Tax=Leucogyrophana mollusca TaxID=85980 RepID=A0ACB8BGM5_9AGAM|nr:hypothetical protein BV22DRAFT_1036044 [Leucogyrophana mollusca]